MCEKNRKINGRKGNEKETAFLAGLGWVGRGQSAKRMGPEQTDRRRWGFDHSGFEGWRLVLGFWDLREKEDEWMKSEIIIDVDRTGSDRILVWEEAFERFMRGLSVRYSFLTSIHVLSYLSYSEGYSILSSCRLQY